MEKIPYERRCLAAQGAFIGALATWWLGPVAVLIVTGILTAWWAWKATT